MKKIILAFISILICSVFYYTISNIKNEGAGESDNNPPQQNYQPKITLEPKQVLLSTSTKINFQLPKGYSIVPSYEGLGRARFMSLSPDGRLFVTDLHSLDDNNEGAINILSDFSSTTKKFEKRVVYMSQLRNPNSVTFYRDKDNMWWIYIALTKNIIRYKYTTGETSPQGEPQIIATFPDYGLNYKYGGWHLTRTITFHDDILYVSVGSSCNSCEEREDEPSRATIMKMNPDGSNQEVYAMGLRNSVGIKWVDNVLYATSMNVDHLGDDRPDDGIYIVDKGKHYGWPYCYEYNRKVIEDTTQQWQRNTVSCASVPLTVAPFGGHAAPLGFDYFKSLDGVARDSFLVALHGSGKVAIGHGYSIVRVDKDGGVEPVITGFISEDKRVGRPVDILNMGNNSFLFSDDFAGVIYYVYKS